MSSYATELRRLQREVGDLVESHERAASLETFSRYRDDPVGFLVEVLGVKNLWHRQREIAELVRDNRHVAVRSCNSAGKDFLGARLALWWTIARGGLSILTGPTERQVKHVLFKELARAFRGNPDLPGELFQLALRIGDEDRILGFTSSDADKLTGFHDPETLVIITEGQGVEPDVYEAAQACATSASSRLLVLGNPLRPTGQFYTVCRSSNWVSVPIPASEHPNVVEGREVIPGAVTREWVETIAQEYGRDSAVYRARVEAEFPSDAIEQLVTREWIENAFGRHRTQTYDSARPLRLVLDVGAGGEDPSCLGYARGPSIEKFELWHEADTMKTVAKVAAASRHEAQWALARSRANVDDYTRATASRPVTLDEIGIGHGVRDRLRELQISVSPFNSSKTSRKPAIYRNCRAEAFWRLRTNLERDRCALPPDEGLAEELLAHEWSLNGSGQIVIAAKDEVKKLIRRSPNKADVCAMAAFGDYSVGMFRLPV
jgi:hypothetical protein